MDIDKMKAGREMDALVAKKVMEWTSLHKAGSEYWWGIPPAYGYECGVPFYSELIAAAWEVVEKMHGNGYGFAVSAAPNEGWYAGIYPEDKPYGHPYGRADTAPLAICRAALKAVEK